MSRSNYSDDCDSGQLNVWRGAVKSAIRGKRGQAFLQELAVAMDAMPDKRLIAGIAAAGGCMCTLAVVAQARGLDMDRLNRLMENEETESIAKMLGIADAMGREIMFENDEGRGEEYWLSGGRHYGPISTGEKIEEKRWKTMRAWVTENLTPATPQGKRQPQWLPIESAPKDGTHILLVNKSGVSEGGWLTDIDHGADWEGQIGMAGFWRADGTDWPNTYWQPLPLPPTATPQGKI